MEEKGILPNLFYEDSTTVIPKSEEDIKRKKIQTNMPMHKDTKILSDTLAPQRQ